MDTIKDRTEPSRRIENFFGGEGGGCPKGADQYDSSVRPPLQFFTKIIFSRVGYLVWLSTSYEGFEKFICIQSHLVIEMAKNVFLSTLLYYKYEERQISQLPAMAP